MINIKFKTLLLTLCLLMVGICVHGIESEERYIVKFNDSMQFFSSRGDSEVKDYCSATKDELLEYIDAGIVEDYGIDYVVKLDSTKEWNLSAIKAEFPEKLSCKGKNVRVAVIDSGFSGSASNALEGYNYIDENTDTTDNLFHGTIVSALLASPHGVAGDAQFVPLKCFDEGKETCVSGLLQAVEDAVDVYGCDVINMSFSFKPENGDFAAIRMFEEKVKYAAEKGVILVASVGNDGNSTLYYPAAYDDVIGVGSVNENGEWSTFSNYNESVFVVAPGEESPVPSGVVSGTSFSAPLVSGLAAVAKCMDGSIDGKQFASILAETAVRTDDKKYDIYYGYGIIDCEAAMKRVMGDYQVFISPIKTGDNGIYSAVYNNTANAMTVRCICVYYDVEGNLEDCKIIDETIDSDDVYIFNNSDSQNGVSYFVWSDFRELVPLAKTRNK